MQHEKLLHALTQLMHSIIHKYQQVVNNKHHVKLTPIANWRTGKTIPLKMEFLKKCPAASILLRTKPSQIIDFKILTIIFFAKQISVFQILKIQYSLSQERLI